MNKDQLKKLEADLWSAAGNNYRSFEAEILAECQNLKGLWREKPVSEIAILFVMYLILKNPARKSGRRYSAQYYTTS